MCLLAILWRVAEDAPLVLAANREEAYARGGTPPEVVDGRVPFIAGLDPVAGGTWLGLNARGVVVAVTNVPRAEHPAQPRSRGLLVRDLLQCETAAEVVREAVHELGTKRYAGCNLFCADTETAFVLHSWEWLRVLPLPTGIHLLTNGGINQTTDPRIEQALAWLGTQSLPTSRMWLDRCKQMCSDPGTDGPPICVRGTTRGTVSSTLLVLRRPLHAGTYLHAQGPPDRTPYIDYSSLLRHLHSPA